MRMKFVPDLSAARAFPTSTTLKLETFSSASTCRDLCSRKLRPDLHLGPARALFVGYFAGPFHREDDANRFAHPGNLYSHCELDKIQAAGCPNHERPATK